MSKQISSVEWLENKFQEMCKDFGGLHTYFIERFEQAKEMEKEQMERAYQQGGIYAQNNFKIRIMNILNPTTAVLAWKAIYYTTKFS